jgi:hypothetical protein
MCGIDLSAGCYVRSRERAEKDPLPRFQRDRGPRAYFSLGTYIASNCPSPTQIQLIDLL